MRLHFQQIPIYLQIDISPLVQSTLDLGTFSRDMSMAQKNLSVTAQGQFGRLRRTPVSLMFSHPFLWKLKVIL